MQLLIPIEMCNSIRFKCDYPTIKIKPWNDTIRINVKNLCGLLTMYANPERFEVSLKEHEQDLIKKKTPYKIIELDTDTMSQLASILDGIASGAHGVPAGQLQYLLDSCGKHYFGIDRARVTNFFIKITEALPHEFEKHLEASEPDDFESEASLSLSLKF